MAKALSFEKRYEIAEWIKANSAGLLAERPTMTSLAARIKGELSYEINPESLRDLCDMLKVIWEPQIRTGGSATRDRMAMMGRIEEFDKYIVAMRADHDKKVTELQTQIDLLKTQLRSLQAASVKLQGAFNYVAKDLAVKIPGWEVPPTDRVNANIAM